MAPYSTRLLVLGVVRIFEPAHGYLLLQELNSWKVDQWANVKPGSVYSALSTLAKDGLLEVVEPTTDDGGSAAKTSYRTTAAGVEEFTRLVKHALTDTDSHTIATTMSSIGFLAFLARAEVLTLLGERLRACTARLAELNSAIDNFDTTGPEAPPHVVEHFYFMKSIVEGNLAWTRGIIARLERGDYSFRGEEPKWTPPEDDPIWGNRHFDR